MTQQESYALWEKFICFIDDLYDEKYAPNINDNTIDTFVEKLESYKQELFCQDGHFVTNDMCGRPEHRYCLFCEATTPHQELSWTSEAS